MRNFASIVGAVAIIYVFATQMLGGLNTDVSWLITVGERMLAGQQLYTDIYELNPPMSALLYLPFVALAQAMKVAPEPIVVAAILAATLASLAFSIRTLKTAGLPGDPSSWWLISLVALTVLPGKDFGQREHIAVILLLPLLAVSIVRSLSRAPRLLEVAIAGLTAGLVMTIKPHFALPIFSIALVSACQARSWRPIVNGEHVLAGLILLPYWLAVWFWFPAFFTKMVPLASAAYLADRQSLQFLLLSPATWLPWLMLAGLLLIYRPSLGIRPNIQYLAAAGGFFLVYLIQGKGFLYHALPIQVLMGIVLAHCFLAKNLKAGTIYVPTALSLLLVAAPAVITLQGDNLRTELKTALASLGPGLKFANFTSQLGVSSPLHRELGGTLINSGPCLWIALGAIRLGTATDDPIVFAEMAKLEDIEREVLRQDMLANPPDIILAGADQFDWLDWARQDTTIAAMLNDYEVIDQVGSKITPLQILKRKPD